MLKEKKLFASLPVNISTKLKDILKYSNICHRSQDF